MLRNRHKELNDWRNELSMKVYVGNLPYSFDDAKLKDFFSSYGEITEAVIIKDKFSGRSKGFGFVTFADKTAAEKAVSEMDGKEIDGRAIKVNEAKPMEPGSRPPRREFNTNRRRF